METETNDDLNVRTDFRLALQQAFVERCRRNPSYSLRAFAKALGIGASPLSAILRGKRPLTSKMKKRLGLALGMSLEEIKEIADSKMISQTEFQQITLDRYAIVSDWYHYAILELVRVQSFIPDLNYISKTLGISKTETQIAVERLQRVGLLEITEKGKWVDTTFEGLATNITDDLSSQASRKLQRQVLEMSLKALEELPTSVRNHTSMTMAINPEDLDEAKKKIKKFRRELCLFFERNRKPTQVYNLGISLYPITKSED